MTPATPPARKVPLTILFGTESGNAEALAMQARAANSLTIKQLEIANDRRKMAEQRDVETSRFREPLARSAHDLRSRLYNILKQDLIGNYLTRGNERERHYVINNTAFVVAQYLCWTELVRREIQFIDLGAHDKTRGLLRLQDSIYRL